MVLHGMARFCMVLHGIAWNCMVVHHLASSCTILRHLAPSCAILHHLALCCTMLHHIAPCCTMVHHVANFHSQYLNELTCLKQPLSCWRSRVHFGHPRCQFDRLNCYFSHISPSLHGHVHQLGKKFPATPVHKLLLCEKKRRGEAQSLQYSLQYSYFPGPL